LQQLGEAPFPSADIISWFLFATARRSAISFCCYHHLIPVCNRSEKRHFLLLLSSVDSCLQSLGEAQFPSAAIISWFLFATARRSAISFCCYHQLIPICNRSQMRHFLLLLSSVDSCLQSLGEAQFPSAAIISWFLFATALRSAISFGCYHELSGLVLFHCFNEISFSVCVCQQRWPSETPSFGKSWY
jgi:hypothetical protein